MFGYQGSPPAMELTALTAPARLFLLSLEDQILRGDPAMPGSTGMQLHYQQQ